MSFAFGKHKGKTFEEVASSDPGYCRWALGQDKPGGGLAEFVEFVKARGGVPGGNEQPRPGAGGKAVGKGAASGKGSPAQQKPLVERARPLNPNVPQLDPQICLVCEVQSADSSFIVRAQHAAGMALGPAELRNDFVYLPPQIWGAIGQLEGAQRAPDGRSWKFPLSLYANTAAHLELMGQVERIPKWVLSLLMESHTGNGDELVEDRLPHGLLPYQLAGVRFGAAHGGRCLIGDEMGLGKTLQGLSLAAQYVEEWPVLVICPSMLRWVWKEQAEQWITDLVKPHEVQVVKKGSDVLRHDAKFYIISYNLLAADAKKEGRFQQRPDGSAHEVVIVDESHNIKDWSTEKTKATVPLVRKATRAVLLSGTPTRNTADELHPQLCALLRGFSPKITEFRSRYCLQQQRQVFGGRMVNQVVGARNSAELNHLLTSTVMVRRLKKDVLSQLPEKRRQKVPLDIADAKLLKDMRTKLAEISGLLESGGGGEAIQTLFTRTAQAKIPAVKEYILEVLDRGDEKAIIFGHHTSMMDALADVLHTRLQKDGQSFIRIDGKTPAGQRQELVKKFQTDSKCRIALLSIVACCEGITLTAAGLVIFAEMYWVPGVVEQAEARAHRIGTEHSKVIVEFLVVPGSPEERIYSAIDRKKKDTSNVLDGKAESFEMKPVAASNRKRCRDQTALDAFFRDSKRPAGVTEDDVHGTSTPPSVRGADSEGLELDGSTTKLPEAPPAPPEPVLDRSKIDLLLKAARSRLRG